MFSSLECLGRLWAWSCSAITIEPLKKARVLSDTQVCHVRRQVEKTSVKKKENGLTVKVTQILSDPSGEKFSIVHSIMKWWKKRLA